LFKNNFESENMACMIGEELKSVVVNSTHWTWVNEGTEEKPKWGFVSDTVGAELVLLLDTRVKPAGGAAEHDTSNSFTTAAAASGSVGGGRNEGGPGGKGSSSNSSSSSSNAGVEESPPVSGVPGTARKRNLLEREPATTLFQESNPPKRELSFQDAAAAVTAAPAEGRDGGGTSNGNGEGAATPVPIPGTPDRTPGLTPEQFADQQAAQAQAEEEVGAWGVQQTEHGPAPVISGS
jgi:hypothetical protein